MEFLLQRIEIKVPTLDPSKSNFNYCNHFHFFGDTTEMIRSSNKPISAIAWATGNPSGITHSGVKTMMKFPRERFGDPNLA